MSALLAARLPGPTTSASISADELNAVLARIRARCRPDLAVSAAQRLEALLGVAEASRAGSASAPITVLRQKLVHVMPASPFSI